MDDAADKAARKAQKLKRAQAAAGPGARPEKGQKKQKLRPQASAERGPTPSAHAPRSDAAAEAAPAPPPSGSAMGGAARKRGRNWTLSIALPGSVVENAQNHELRSFLVAQVARAATIFHVDEIVIFGAASDKREPKRTPASVFMARLLQYLECPQYLRRMLFPVHPDLRAVGILPPIDATHHPRAHEAIAYREGVARDDGATALIGLQSAAPLDRKVPAGSRLTVRMPTRGGPNAPVVKPTAASPAVVVAPSEPREAAGLHWGFAVRVADTLPAVWTECPYERRYDLAIGTSDKGTAEWAESDFEFPRFEHALLVFGGVEGLEPVVAADAELSARGVTAPELFDHYFNLCPEQGSRTIRTEEALLVGLTALRPLIQRASARPGPGRS